jgi:Tol biopolymer transport system component
MVVSADGGKPRQIADQIVEDSGRYSPDGETVVTSTGESVAASITGTIIFLNVATGKIVNRIAEEGHFLFGPCWSPDGKHVAYLKTPLGQHMADIYISQPDGSDTRNVTNSPDHETIVDWGP